MNEAQRVAKKFGNRQIISEAIQDFAQAVAEKIRSVHISPDDDYRVWFNTGLTDAARLLLREAGIEGKNG